MSVARLGRFDGKAHILPLRIYYEDTDLSGVVYHANYLRFMERGRTEFFRLAGITKMADARRAPSPPPGRCAKCVLEYLRPARVDDRSGPHAAVAIYRRAHEARSEDLLPARFCWSHGAVEACIITLNGQAAAHSAGLLRESLHLFL